MSKIELMKGNCLEMMKSLPDNGISLTVTSPPYDNLRTYKSSLEWSSNVWEGVLKELYRLTAEGGVVVWVVGDSSIGGGESGSSFKQALYAMSCGFTLNDTMIYEKPNRRPRQYRANRYEQCFEYMFVFVKGTKSKVFNLLNEPCINAGKSINFTSRDATKDNNFTSGDVISTRKSVEVGAEKRKGNIWMYSNTGSKDHPAVFPEKLAEDHILSWSNEGDVVFDPFMGSGTTGKMAVLHSRNFIGIEKVDNYFNIAEKRIREALDNKEKNDEPLQKL